VSPPADRSDAVAALVGGSLGPPVLSPHAVNAPMIRHWVEAMGDENPVYVSEEAAREAGFDGVIAPATMLQSWIMRGLRATQALEAARAAGHAGDASPHEQMLHLLDEEGLTSVVATNCEQSYERPLRPGDRLVSAGVIESVSDVKTTALGAGRFVTTRVDFVAVDDAAVTAGGDSAALFAAGEPVATMRFRILKYRPASRTDEPGDAAAPAPPGALRPRPAITQDIAFWFEGARRGQLLIQRCASCGTLRHPPLPACAVCRSFDWDTIESTGRGEIFSFVVIHHPRVPGFEYPLPIGLVQLEEGTRLVADLGGAPPEAFHVGMKVAARFVAFDDELTLPVFHPVEEIAG
jgi:uncharacterized OB-fold protein